MEWKDNTNWKATIEENLRMGVTELLILQLLCERDMYAYEIQKYLAENVERSVPSGDSATYVLLLRMASRKLVSTRKEYANGKRFRNYYHIEEFGREYLNYGKKQYLFLHEKVLKIFCLGGNDHGKE